MLRNTGVSLQSHLPQQLNEVRNNMLKERHLMLNADNTRKLRVVDKNDKPVLQEKLPGASKFTTQFPNSVNGDNGRAGRNLRSGTGRSNTINLENEEH